MGIYVWGTGCGASELTRRGLAPERIAGFVDSSPSGDTFLDRPVFSPESFPADDCDLMIVANRHADAVAQRCRELGLSREKLFFLKNAQVLTDRNNGSDACKILGQELAEKLVNPMRVMPVPGFLRDSRFEEKELENDPVRLSTLELLTRRLGDVPGAAAELGVYRGAFARCVNLLLPQRTLYLFDSFQGFSEGDHPSEAFHQAHRNTTMDRVRAIMPHPERVVIKPGFFPASVQGLEERFCLVSLDVDFEESTLAGLRYFWPRLSPGGYLLLHDWNSPELSGVARALERYEQELGRTIPGVPLCDAGGTMVLCKDEKYAK